MPSTISISKFYVFIGIFNWKPRSYEYLRSHLFVRSLLLENKNFEKTFKKKFFPYYLVNVKTTGIREK